MAKEETLQAEDSLIARPLGFATGLLLRAPKAVFLLAVVLAVVSLAITAQKLHFRTSRLDLLNPRSEYNQRWLAYLDEFGRDDDVIVLIEGPDQQTITAAIDSLAHSLLRQDRLFHAVLYKQDLSIAEEKGLQFLALEELRQTELFVQQAEPIVRGGWSQLNTTQYLASLNNQLRHLQKNDAQTRERMLQQIGRLSGSLTAAFEEPGRYQSPWPKALASASLHFEPQSNYLLSDNGQLGFILLRIRENQKQFSRGNQAIAELRKIVKNINRQHPQTKIGVTGMPVMENDEMRASQDDTMKASLLSLAGVACLFIAGFGGLRHPLLTVATLMLSMAWAFAYVTLTIGHLNILSVSFGVILLGLGIDFGIHYVARYLQLRKQGSKCKAALVETASTVGPGIVTGGLTTAIAFCTAALTEFTGVAELGLIAGGGIILCIIGALFVLPALIYLTDRHRKEETIPSALPFGDILRPFLRFPRVILGLSFVATLAAASGLGMLHYDHNLLNLQPLKLESVQLEKALLEKTDRSVWFALSMSQDLEELRRRKAQFEKLESIDRIEDIISFLPEENPEKDQAIIRIRERLRSLPPQPPLIAPPSPKALLSELRQMQMLLTGDDISTQDIQGILTNLRGKIQRTPHDEQIMRLTQHQQQMANDYLNRLQTIGAAANPAQMQLSDLPRELVVRFVGKTNHHLLKVYAQGDIWDMDSLQKFVAEVESVDPQITGHPIQTYYASRQMKQSYLHAAIYSFLAVAIVLMLDFRSIRYSALAMIPVVLGMLQLFGVLGLLGISLNPANMIVLPLILGIGIDDGVHVIHDFRLQRGRYQLSNSTATAILLTSSTTMMGFGSLMLASHQGLRSLGQVLTIGVFCCLASSIIILPAILHWATRFRADRPDEDSGEQKTTQTSAIGRSSLKAAPAETEERAAENNV